MMNIGEALLPALRLEQRKRSVTRRPLYRYISKPKHQAAVVRRHVQQTDGRTAEVIPPPRTNQNQLNYGKRPETERDTEAILTSRDPDIVGKEQKEENHPDLNHAHATLRSDDGLHPRRDLR